MSWQDTKERCYGKSRCNATHGGGLLHRLDVPMSWKMIRNKEVDQIRHLTRQIFVLGWSLRFAKWLVIGLYPLYVSRIFQHYINTVYMYIHNTYWIYVYPLFVSHFANLKDSPSIKNVVRFCNDNRASISLHHTFFPGHRKVNGSQCTSSETGAARISAAVKGQDLKLWRIEVRSLKSLLKWRTFMILDSQALNTVSTYAWFWWALAWYPNPYSYIFFLHIKMQYTYIWSILIYMIHICTHNSKIPIQHMDHYGTCVSCECSLIPRNSGTQNPQSLKGVRCSL